eukprot:TRINITY_DN785_c0_g1_i2.p1 TRINITY_DN785_c0_g1~~TRINITY_DN785_c0_g1_i2.p1  ORF type:complete len:329 (-),score=111.95 TRINITY_DN785_c0_g1_i2:2655-3641(-)
MSFWGVEVVPLKTFTTTLEAPLIVSNAALGSHVKPGDRTSLYVKVGDTRTVLCSLRPGKVEHASISLELDAGTKVSFAVKGECAVHISGFYTEPIGEESEGESDMDSDDQFEDASDSSEEDKQQQQKKKEKAVKHQPLTNLKRKPSNELDDDTSTKKRRSSTEDKKKKKEAEERAKEEEYKKQAEALRKRQEKLLKEKQAAEARQKKESGGLRLNIDMKHPSGLIYRDTKAGSGKKAQKGRPVSVHYTGRLQKNGRVFDSSRKRGKPFQFMLGKGQVIRGWDIGVEGMQVGQKRTLTIPAKLGYGARGAPPDIPGGATLVFDVECMKV